MPRMKLDNPPVVERVFTLQFMPLPGFDLIHIGLWFEKIRDRFPVFSRQQLLGHITESFPFRHEVSRLRFDVDPVPKIPRCVFAADDSDYGRLHQLQSDRFAMNWRRDHGHSYMDYEKASDEFLAFFEKFEEFCEAQDLGRPVLDLCEVIYLNRIDCPDGDVERRWREVFGKADLVNENAGFPKPVSLSGNSVYDFPAERGRLRIEAWAGDHEGHPAIHAKIIGRAIVKPDCDRRARLKAAHDWVVDGFEAVTTKGIRRQEWRQQL
jgi:uncharacterized protein (TIGR04255 family)